MTEKCEHVGKRGGCKFEPRFDLVLPDREISFDKYTGDMGGLDVLKNKIYICDICVQCGRTVPRIGLENGRAI